MYRSAPCGHCGMSAADDTCAGCGLWICPSCRAHGSCQQTREAWTGACKRCGTPYPDEQRRAVIDDGEGPVLCYRCGSGFHLRRLSTLEDEVIEQLRAAPLDCDQCQDVPPAWQLFVLEDQWATRTRTQRIFHLLCGCGATLASSAD